MTEILRGALDSIAIRESIPTNRRFRDTVTTIRNSGGYFNGYAYHAFRFCAHHPDADPKVMNPVDRENWIMARDVLAKFPVAVTGVFKFWGESTCLDQAVHEAATRHGCSSETLFKALREACREFAVRRGLLWHPSVTEEGGDQLG